MKRINIVLVVALLLIAAPSFAQVARVRPNDRVRVSTVGDRTVGKVVSIGEMLVVRVIHKAPVVTHVGYRAHLASSGETLVEIPLSTVTKLEKSGGRKRNALNGALTGLLVGGAAGVLTGFAAGDDEPGTFIAFTAGEKATLGGVLLGGTGLVVGAVAGALMRTEKWDSVPLNWVQVGFGPQRKGGFGMTAALSF